MILEIERKFLLKSNLGLDFLKNITTIELEQGYIVNETMKTVRLRKENQNFILTIKGKSTKSGLIRPEFETKLNISEYETLATMLEPGCIIKKRYELIFSGQLFEVDVFEDDNQGLVLVEIELKHEDDKVSLPPWLGVEVTGDPRYYNSYLCKKPYSTWN